MKNSDIASRIDHTCLTQTATLEQIITLCDEGIKGNAASICIPPSFTAFASQYVQGKIDICTVIGFPNGYNTSKVKLFETADALENGAAEIDMVINLSMLKDKKYDDILGEIISLKNVCGNKILKVIIETCLLEDPEKIIMCEIVCASGADFIKTSTGFSSAGATEHDIALFKKYCKGIKIKAAGGIKDLDFAFRLIEAGADRIGSSSLLKLVAEI